ncbi:MAG: transcriptional regulator [Candidatus Saccharibacteria bacterium]|nr:transcriptional regulator [Candidatus Saccharibacteria bacterium]MCY4088970.1 transcriptional regulator [Candidatus Saccharibacteria bacterium]
MIENLFGSKTRYKLLRLFLSNPNQSFYVREITRKINEQINSVRRELSNLLSIGVITSDSANNKLYYEVNQKFDKYKDLFNLFNSVTKVVGGGVTKTKDSKATTKSEAVVKTPTPKLPAQEKALGNVSLVVLGGIFTLDARAPADVLIVGNVTPSSLKTYVDNLEASIDGEIRYLVMNEEEFHYRLKIKDRFTATMLSSKLVVKVDKHSILKNAD